MSGERLKEVDICEGDNGLGEEHRDCTGERERAPDIKLPEDDIGGAECMGVNAEMRVEDTGEEVLEEEMKEPQVFACPAMPVLAAC